MYIYVYSYCVCVHDFLLYLYIWPHFPWVCLPYCRFTADWGWWFILRRRLAFSGNMPIVIQHETPINQSIILPIYFCSIHSPLCEHFFHKDVMLISPFGFGRSCNSPTIGHPIYSTSTASQNGAANWGSVLCGPLSDLGVFHWATKPSQSLTWNLEPKNGGAWRFFVLETMIF